MRLAEPPEIVGSAQPDPAATALLGAAPDASQVHLLADHRIAVDTEARLVRVDKAPRQDVTRKEFRILLAFAQHPDTVLHPSDLHDLVWGADDSVDTSETLHVHISKLRSKLGAELGHPKEGAIRTRHNLGYCAVSSLTGEVAESTEEPLYLADKRLRVNVKAKSMAYDGVVIDNLTPTQFAILHKLASNVDKVVAHAAILQALESLSIAELDGLRVHMSALRQKLGPNLGHPKAGVIRTLPQVGYYAVSSLRDSRDLSTAS